MLALETPKVDWLKIKIENGTVSSNATEESKHFEKMLLEQLRLSGTVKDGSFGLERKPEFGYRGFMLDTVRHFYPMESVKRLIKLVALFGGNIFHWHLTDDQGWRFLVPGYEEECRHASMRRDTDYKGREYGGYYTDEEIKDTVEYAASLGVEIVPEIETPGHATAIVSAMPQIGCTGKNIEVETTYGIFEDILNPSRSETFTFLEAAIRKLASLFPGRFIHVGGDECPHTQWKESAEIQRFMKENGLRNEDELQGWMTSRVSEIVIRCGKRPIAWDEALDAPNIPKSLVIMNWHDEESAKEALRRGHEVIMCPEKGAYLDRYPQKGENECGNLSISTVKDSYLAKIVPDGVTNDQRALILGAQANLWCELISRERMAELMIFPRLIAFFEALENYSGRDWEEFKARKRDIQILLSDLGIAFYPGDWE
jgi:N-acetyl-beta-hexosaminidase